MKDLILSPARIGQIHDWRSEWKKQQGLLKKYQQTKSDLEEATMVRVKVMSSNANHGMDVVYETLDLKEAVLIDLADKIKDAESKQMQIETKLEAMARTIHDEVDAA